MPCTEKTIEFIFDEIKIDIDDERAPVTRYYLIKESRPLDTKYYSVNGGFSSVTKPCNNMVWHLLVKIYSNLVVYRVFQ